MHSDAEGADFDDLNMVDLAWFQTMCLICLGFM